MEIQIGDVCLFKNKTIIIIEELSSENFIFAPLVGDFNSTDPLDVVFDKSDLIQGSIDRVRADMSSISCIKGDLITKVIGKLKVDSFEKILMNYIKRHIGNYYEAVHKPAQTTEFKPGESRINYAGRVYDKKELLNVVDSSLEFYLTAKRYDKTFCKLLSEFLSTDNASGIKVLTANSGSSANLLALSALTSYKLGDAALREGDEVITVAAGFPTTISPIIQNRLVPVFVDIELGTYNINTDLIQQAVSSRTKAIYIAHTLGIPFNVDKVLEIAEKFNLWVIEDNCDSLGAEYTLKREYNLLKGLPVAGKKQIGTFGHIGTSSFYPAHQLTMGEGGAVYTYDIDLHRILLSFRDWGRDCWCEPGNDNTCKNRFKSKLGDLPEGYDHKYTYSHLGYNMKITDLQAAIGVAQMEKLPFFIKSRRANWEKLFNGLKELEEYFILPHYPANSKPSPFGFALTVREKTGFSRQDITMYLEENKIQTRTLFAGNMLKQPALVNTMHKYKIAKDLKNTDIAMNNTFWVGVYPGLKDGMIEFIIDKIKEFVKNQ